ncbi:MAG: tetratricopeptide repeat protein [Methylophagaceae bacterium]
MAQANNDIRPFWDIIPQFFLIPLKGAGVIALLLFTSLATFFPHIFILIAVFFVVIKYGMEILQNTAEGRLKAPELSFRVLNENYELPFKQLFLFLLPVLLMTQATSFTAFIVISNVILFYLFVLPASVMTLSYTHSFFSAINPFVLISLIGRIGWSYGILYVFLLFLNGGASAAYYFLVGDSPDASIFLALFFQIYFAWVMYAMMGYVLYQYHEDIGYELPEDAIEQDEDSGVLASFHHLVETENYTAAQNELREIVLRDPDNLDLRMKFHKIVKMAGDNKQLAMHGTGLINRLLEKRKWVDAVNIYLDCVKAEPRFRPESDTHYLPLAEEMRRMRLYKQAIKLSNGFHQHYPKSEQIPYLYLLVTKIFIEDLSLDEKAKPILSLLQKKYSGHEIAPEVKRYNTFLTKV